MASSEPIRGEKARSQHELEKRRVDGGTACSNVPRAAMKRMCDCESMLIIYVCVIGMIASHDRAKTNGKITA